MVHTPASLPSSKDLTQEEVQALEDEQNFSSPAQNGRRNVSVRFLNPERSTTSSVTGPPSVTVCYHRFDYSSTKTIVIPEHLDSVATLELMGLEPSSAETIFAKWISRLGSSSSGSGKGPGNDDKDKLIDHVLGEISKLGTPEFEEQDYAPREEMTALGVNQKMQDALADPLFSDIFGTETVQFWVEDPLRNNYLGLEDKIRMLKERATQNVMAAGV